MPAITKLSKKQKKALEFKLGKKEKTDLVEKPSQEPVKETPAKPKPVAKKRFTLFIGNLPYELPDEELKAHFKSSNPSQVRMRKGFAFLDFDGPEAAANLNTALKLHHSTLKYRKINVELTAGGGGNSKERRKKIDKKNKAVQEELAERLEQDRKEKEKKKEKTKEDDLAMVHPSRRQNFA